MLVQQPPPGVFVLLGTCVRGAFDDLFWILQMEPVVNIVWKSHNVRDVQREQILELLSDLLLVSRQVVPNGQYLDPVIQYLREALVRDSCS